MCNCKPPWCCPNNKLVDLSKPVQTRDGKPARVLVTDRKGEFPVVALILHEDRDREAVHLFTHEGHCVSTKPSSNLINLPERKELFLNVYNDSVGYVCPTQKDADSRQTPHRSGLIKLTYEDDELVSVDIVK